MSLLVAMTAAAVLTGAGLQAATGFGFGLVAAPLLFAATSPPEAVGLLMLLGLEINLLTLGAERRRPAPLRPDTVALLAWALPGMALGVVILRGLDETALQIMLTAGVLGALIVRRLRPAERPPPRWALPAAGVSAGALNLATSTAGPPLVLYLLRRRVTPGETRDTLTAIFLAFSVLGMVVLAATGTREAVPGLGWVLATVPLVALGHLAGRRVFARLSPAAHVRALTLTLLASVVTGLATVVL